MTPFLSEIDLFPFNFPPTGWAQCDGQLIAISQNTALFSLLGTFYGGNGTSNFALPDLRGRVPIHQGQGPGLSNYNVGDSGGVETNTISH
ncbi:MAG: tail fiber protein [Chitinophagaceae bacterium]|nr:tail fiber protein [Chitinophagaceae bacterium]